MNTNNEFFLNSMINARKDNDEWKNASGACSPNLIEKSINENGEYLAKTDGADGYSSVTVNVENQINALAFYTSNSSYIGLFWSQTGEYACGDSGLTGNLSYGVLCNPAISIEVNTGGLISSYDFTPGESFIVTKNGVEVTLTGDTVTPNDGKIYNLRVSGGPDGQPRYTITKTNSDFGVTIL